MMGFAQLVSLGEYTLLTIYIINGLSDPEQALPMCHILV